MSGRFCSSGSCASAVVTKPRARNGHALARGERAQAVDAATARQCHQPGKRPSAILVEVRRPPPNLQENFLQHVLRFFAVI
jgi:hypothetical protein